MKQGVHRQKYRLTPLYLSSKEEGEMFTIEIYSARLKGFVIDEGHCFNKWSAIFDALLIPYCVHVLLCCTSYVSQGLYWTALGKCVRHNLGLVMAIMATATNTLQYSAISNGDPISARSPSKKNVMQQI